MSEKAPRRRPSVFKLTLLGIGAALVAGWMHGLVGVFSGGVDAPYFGVPLAFVSVATGLYHRRSGAAFGWRGMILGAWCGLYLAWWNLPFATLTSHVVESTFAGLLVPILGWPVGILLGDWRAHRVVCAVPAQP